MMPGVANYFDLQVNGYGGVDFNTDELSAEGLHAACEALRADGVAQILATIITEDLGKMAARLRRIVELRERDALAKEMIPGLHIEGPFISPETGYVGAHPKDAVRPATPEDMARLLEAAGGLARIVTLAPEHDGGYKTTRMLADQGITVSAGHTNASFEQLSAAADAGLRMFTHLGNGCPMNVHRHDNIVQRGLALADRLWIGFIADGVHVPFFALKNYLKAATLDRCFVVTDAIAPAGKGPGRYQMARWDLLIGEDLVARAPDGSHFVGSAIDMPRVMQNLTKHMGLGEAEALRLTRDNPRRAIA